MSPKAYLYPFKSLIFHLELPYSTSLLLTHDAQSSYETQQYPIEKIMKWFIS